MNNFDVIKTVRLTEKGSRQGGFNQYTVISDRRANKMNVSGKYRRQRTAQAGQTSDWKKAIVTLKKGDKISLV